MKRKAFSAGRRSGLLVPVGCVLMAFASSVVRRAAGDGDADQDRCGALDYWPGCGARRADPEWRVACREGGQCLRWYRGRPIKVIIEDDGSNPDNARTKANALVHNEKVVGLLGPSQVAQIVAAGAVTDPSEAPAHRAGGPVGAGRTQSADASITCCRHRSSTRARLWSTRRTG